MKKTNQRLLTLVATAMLVSGVALAAEPTTPTTAESASTPAQPAMKPHNHMRDAKGMGMGMGMGDKHGAATKDSSAETPKDDSEKPGDAGKKKPHGKTGVGPHNHPRDAKAY